MALPASLKTVFAERGIVCLKGAVTQKATARVKASILNELDRLQLRKQGQFATASFKSVPVFQQTTRLGQMVKVDAEMAALYNESLATAVRELSDGKIKVGSFVPQLLLSLPHAQEWNRAELNWHLDLAVPESDEVPGIQLFILIDDLEPRGGATLALAGSHRLPYVGGTNKNRGALAALRGHPAFTSAADFSSINVDGVEVSLVEMTGRAGDVYFMDMRLLHSPSINAGKKARMMATARYQRPPRR